jgi:peptide subunit release factor 1 (eRF1)
MEAAAVSVCPACGATLQPAHDLGHRIVGRTLEQRGRVEVVHGPPAQRLMQAGQGLGALLRFNWPAGVLESQIRPAPGA